MKPNDVKSDAQAATQPEGKSDRQSDDSQTHILKPSTEKLCFPGAVLCSNRPLSQALTNASLRRFVAAIPIALPHWPTFRHFLGLENANWDDLNYADWCVAQGAMKHTADAMANLGLNASSVNIPGQAGPLRIAEGVDSIQNIVNSANADTATAASGYLICSITQAGGLMYSFIMLSIVSVLLVVIPFFNWLSQFVYDLGCLGISTAGSTIYESDAESDPDSDPYR